MTQYKILVAGDMPADIKKVFKDNNVRFGRIADGVSSREIARIVGCNLYNGLFITGPTTRFCDCSIAELIPLKVVGCVKESFVNVSLEIAKKHGIPVFMAAEKTQSATQQAVQDMCDFLHKGTIENATVKPDKFKVKHKVAFATLSN